MLVTADTEFSDHLRRYQLEHNTCCWGLVLLPSEELKQIEVLKRVKAGKLKLRHPVDPVFQFEEARMKICSSTCVPTHLKSPSFAVASGKAFDTPRGITQLRNNLLAFRARCVRSWTCRGCNRDGCPKTLYSCKTW